MKKICTFVVLLFGLLVMNGSPLPAHAADESPAPAAADAPKADAKDAKGEEGGKKEGDKENKGEEGGGKKKGSGDITGGRFEGDPIYVRLQPITLPIIDANGVEQLVTVQIAVEVRDFDVGDDMHSNMPKVMDALNRALYGSLEDGSARNGRMVDVERLKAKATAALAGVVGADNIKEVLIMNLSQRML